MKLLEKDELILLEDVINYNNFNKECDLCLTNKKIIIKPKSIFSRKILIFLDEIKIYRNKIKLEQKDNIVYMQNVNGNAMLNFDNEKKAKAFIDGVYKGLGIKRPKINAKAVLTAGAVVATSVVASMPGVSKAVKSSAPIIKETVKEVAPTVAKKIIDKVSEKN